MSARSRKRANTTATQSAQRKKARQTSSQSSPEASQPPSTNASQVTSHTSSWHRSIMTKEEDDASHEGMVVEEYDSDGNLKERHQRMKMNERMKVRMMKQS